MGNNRSNANVPAGWSLQDRRFGESLKQNVDVLQGQRGDKLDRAVTFRDLLDAGIVQLASGITNFNGLSSSIGIVNEFPDLAIPPAPTNLVASGAFRNIILTWNLKLYKGHSAVQVWRHTSDVISSATMVAQVSGFTGVYADPVGSGKTFYYWVRAINQNDITGPYNSSTGVQGVTAPDVSFLLTTLANAVTYGQLASSLSDPIALIPAHTSGIAALDTFTGYTSGYSGDSLITRMGAVETSSAAGVSSAQFNSEVTTRTNADSALSSSITTLTATVAGNTAGISSEATTRANSDGALSTLITAVTATAAGNTGAITTEQTARANADGALSSSITAVSTTVGQNTAAVQTAATSINGLEAQYTVKIDVNGAVAGYGLASTTTAAGNIVSEFVVNADRFAIMRGGSNSATASVPFIVQASATTLNGVAVPSGVYMTDGFIKNGSIVNAKIGDAAIDNAKIANLDAGKINAGTINTSRLNIDGSTLTSVGGVLQIANLAVTNAKIGNLAVDNAKIGNLAVSTLKIQDQAVTFPSAAVNNSTLTGTHNNTLNSYVTIQTLTATFTGAPVMISGSFSVRSHNDQALMAYRLRRGSTVLFTSQTKAVRPSPDLFVIPYNFLDTNTSSGSRTYTLQAYVGDEYGYYSDRTIQTLETKK